MLGKVCDIASESESDEGGGTWGRERGGNDRDSPGNNSRARGPQNNVSSSVPTAPMATEDRDRTIVVYATVTPKMIAPQRCSMLLKHVRGE